MEKVRAYLDKPVWSGGRTLHAGEIAVLVIGLIILFWFAKGLHLWKNLWFWLFVVMVLLAMIIW